MLDLLNIFTDRICSRLVDFNVIFMTIDLYVEIYEFFPASWFKEADWMSSSAEGI